MGDSQEEFSSVRSSRVTTPTGNCHYPESIMDIEERVAFMTEVVDRASSATPTERRSLSRTPSIASERSSYSSRSSRNSSIVSEKAPFARNSSIMSKDSAISEDISKEIEEKSSGSDKRWSDLEKKYSRGLSSSSIGETISKLAKSSEDSSKNERPKDLMISQKKITNGINSPSSKNFKELAEKWQTMSVPESVSASSSVSTLPRKSSREKSREEPVRASELATLPRRSSREKSPAEQTEPSSWCSPPAIKGSYYQVTGQTEWSGFDIGTGGKGEMPDRKYSVPAFNESAVKLREKKDNVPSRPPSRPCPAPAVGRSWTCLVTGIIAEPSVSMIFGALLKKPSSPCQPAAPADPRDRDCPLRPATTGCPAWTARPPARRAASPPRTSTAVSAASPRTRGGQTEGSLRQHHIPR